MKILLIGPGSVGAYFCGRAAQGGALVEVVARRGHEEIRRDGFTIRSIAGDFLFRPARVLHGAGEASADIDLIVLATKVLPDIDRPALLRPAAMRANRPPIMLLQNGIGIEDEIAANFPQNELLSAVAYIGASRSAVNVIDHRGSGRLILGRFGGGSSPAAEMAAELFRAGNIPCEVTGNIALERWRKLLWNLPFNPVSVISGGLDTRQMCDGGEMEKLCSGLMDEVIAVANARGVPLTRKMAEEQLEYTRNFPAYKTSMLQDFLAGRPLEIDAIIGNAAKIAAAENLHTPLIDCCTAFLRALTRPKA